MRDKRPPQNPVAKKGDTPAERLFITEESITGVDGGVLVRFEGDIAPACVADTEQFLDRLVAEGRCLMIIDLSSVSYVCSAGWGAFLGRVKDIRRAGGDIMFAGLRSQVMSVFDLLEANRIFKVFGGEGEAVRALRSSRGRPDSRKNGK